MYLVAKNRGLMPIAQASFLSLISWVISGIGMNKGLCLPWACHAIRSAPSSLSQCTSIVFNPFGLWPVPFELEAVEPVNLPTLGHILTRLLFVGGWNHSIHNVWCSYVLSFRIGVVLWLLCSSTSLQTNLGNQIHFLRKHATFIESSWQPPFGPSFAPIQAGTEPYCATQQPGQSKRFP